LVVALLATAAVYAIFLVPEHLEAKRKGACIQNQAALARALQLYLSEWDDEFPAPNSWCDELFPYIRESSRTAKGGPFSCPAAANREGSYALSSALSGVKASAIVEHDASQRGWTVAVFESDAGWNAAGGSELLPDQPRHFTGDCYIAVDGHATWVPRKGPPDGPWAKEPSFDHVIWEPVLKVDDAAP
jgi:hypothetical protein